MQRSPALAASLLAVLGSSPLRAQATRADLVFTNGNVITVDPN
jgi:hypothetical protein